MRVSPSIAGLSLLLAWAAGCSSHTPDPIGKDPLGVGGGVQAGGAPNTGGKLNAGATTSSGGKTSAGASTREDLNEVQRQELKVLQDQLAGNEDLSADGLLAKRAIQHKAKLSYRPTESEFLDRVQKSALALNQAELDRLDQNGFVISKRSAFPTFVRGYSAIYAEHLPVYVSADAILEAVHASYDDLLLSFERQALIPSLQKLLDAVHREVASRAATQPQAAAGLDLYLSVARSLLSGNAVAPLAGANAKQIQDVVAMAKNASGEAMLDLLGHPRKIDASQFKPRGHYNDDPQLSNYFRAMIWLGRIDFRLIETLEDGKQIFLRPQYEGMLLLRQSMSAESMAGYASIDAALRTFVGESDNMTVDQVDQLVTALGGLEAAGARSDAEIEAALIEGGFGAQRIASQIMVNNGEVPTLPLARSFALFGQRYVIDSHVFSQVVYDRVPDLRMMPSTLDVAYAALGNDQALSLLAPQLANFNGYPEALESARTLVDAHGTEYWNSNFYTLWLGSLRALSPASDSSDLAKSGLPEVVGTEAWGRRILSTQLGSWAELRHDTLLYAKQSYTGVPACDFPDAYVDPYPEFYDRLRAFAEAGAQLAERFKGATSSLTAAETYFQNLRSTMTLLGQMARNQREGTPFTEDQLAFVNRAVRIVQENVVCTTVDAPDGWLADLYLNRDRSIEAKPTIADVHTQPADEGGNPVGKVLHVGTGWPRLMVTTVDTCKGPRAYVGVTFAYHEVETRDYQRITDQAWTQTLSEPQPDPAWVEPILAQ